MGLYHAWRGIHRQRRRRELVRVGAGLSARCPVHWQSDGAGFGTSLGAPSWAGLIALLNQGRASAGHAALSFRRPECGADGNLVHAEALLLTGITVGRIRDVPFTGNRIERPAPDVQRFRSRFWIVLSYGARLRGAHHRRH